jgi:hypothetical protein
VVLLGKVAEITHWLQERTHQWLVEIGTNTISVPIELEYYAAEWDYRRRPSARFGGLVKIYRGPALASETLFDSALSLAPVFGPQQGVQINDILRKLTCCCELILSSGLP